MLPISRACPLITHRIWISSSTPKVLHRLQYTLAELAMGDMCWRRLRTLIRSLTMWSPPVGISGAVRMMPVLTSVLFGTRGVFSYSTLLVSPWLVIGAITDEDAERLVVTLVVNDINSHSVARLWVMMEMLYRFLNAFLPASGLTN